MARAGCSAVIIRPVSIALVSCRNPIDPDPDAEILLEACLGAGIETRYVPWEDPNVDWSQFEAAVLHSTWNYYETPDTFRWWAKSTARQTQLINPWEIVDWNVDKHYLLELEAKGVPVVPTRIVRSCDEMQGVVQEEGWSRFVIKPTISASSFMAKAFHREEIDQAIEFGGAFKGAPFMVQRFLPNVADSGEIALVHIDGELTHGVIKRPRFHGGEESVSGAVAPQPEQARVAAQAVAQIPGPWLYARVDLMLDDDGSWLLSELELIEPSLFFLQHPPALERFVTALARRLGRI